MKNVISMDIIVGDEGQRKSLKGRTAWALANLVAAGARGCTPLDHPGPRWSDYVFKLKKKGIAVETITENHGGPFTGHHARYVLQSPVTVLAEEVA